MKTPKTTGDASEGQLGENEILNGSNTLPALIEIAEGKSVQLGEIVQTAFKESGLTVEAWNALDETERDRQLNAVIDAMKTISEYAPGILAPGLEVTCLVLHNGARIEPGRYEGEALRSLPFAHGDDKAFADLVKIGAIVLDKEDDDAEAQS